MECIPLERLFELGPQAEFDVEPGFYVIEGTPGPVAVHDLQALGEPDGGDLPVLFTLKIRLIDGTPLAVTTSSRDVPAWVAQHGAGRYHVERVEEGHRLTAFVAPEKT